MGSGETDFLRKMSNFESDVDLPLNEKDHHFLFLGAGGTRPHTDPLKSNRFVQLDANGFVAQCGANGEACDPHGNAIPSVVPVGDVRPGHEKQTRDALWSGSKAAETLAIGMNWKVEDPIVFDYKIQGSSGLENTPGFFMLDKGNIRDQSNQGHMIALGPVKKLLQSQSHSKKSDVLDTVVFGHSIAGATYLKREGFKTKLITDNLPSSLRSKPLTVPGMKTFCDQGTVGAWERGELTTFAMDGGTMDDVALISPDKVNLSYNSRTKLYTVNYNGETVQTKSVILP